MVSRRTSFILQDLLPRLVGVVFVVVGAWIILYTLDKKDMDKWASILEPAAVEAGSTARLWLDRKSDLATQLAEDPRIAAAFTDARNMPQSVRRGLYEFSYINEIKNVHLFDFSRNRSVARTGGAPDLPLGAIDAVSYNANRKISTLVTLLDSGDLMAAAAVRGPTGNLLGYAIYLQPVAEAMSSMEMPAKASMKDVHFSLYRQTSNGPVMGLLNYAKSIPTPQRVTYDPEAFPLFTMSGLNNGRYVGPRDKEVIAVINSVPVNPTWAVVAAIDVDDVRAVTSALRTLVKSLAVALVLALLIIPGHGPYSKILMHGYSKVLPVQPTQPKAPRKLDDLEYNPKGVSPRGINALGNKPAVKPSSKPKRPPQEHHLTESEISYNIRTGIKNKRMRLLYQPVVDVKTGLPEMYEVYSRILDEKGEVMAPAEFLPVAHKENLLGDIDEAVVTTAVEKHFFSKTPLRASLAFNIAGNTFESLNFLEHLMNAATRGVPLNDRTVFELRSREIIEDKRAMGFIRECREMGFRFAIDYFGGGTQTLKAAKTLKFDYVKLDALSFNLKNANDQKTFIKLVKTAEAIHLPVIVEKIENARMLTFCKKLGVSYVQGYYIGKPEPYVPENPSVVPII